MKFAFRRSLWQGRSGCAPRACSIRLATVASRASYSAGERDAALHRRRVGTSSTTRNESKRPGIAGPVVDAPQRACDLAQRLGPPHLLRRDGRALDEPRDEAALGSTNATTSGPTPIDAATRAASCSAWRSIPSSSGVASRDPQHEALAADVDLEVVVRDPAAERLDLYLPPRPDRCGYSLGLHAGDPSSRRARAPPRLQRDAFRGRADPLPDLPGALRRARASRSARRTTTSSSPDSPTARSSDSGSGARIRCSSSGRSIAIASSQTARR